MTISSAADSPILRIETGFHTAMINYGSLSVDGSLLLTASDDKTARLWHLPDFTLLRTFRPQIGEGDEGKLYAAALSPDGNLAAYGGWTSKAVYDEGICIVSTDDGQIFRYLGGLPQGVASLAFSPDGQQLATGLGKAGIRVWRLKDGQKLIADLDYGDRVHGLSFASDGRLATASYDGYLRLYGADLVLRAKVLAKGGKRPYRLAFSPDGKYLAVGFSDAAKVEVLESNGLHSLGMGENSGNYLCLSEVAWSRDGTTLLAGGRKDGPPNSLMSWPWREEKLGRPSTYALPAQDTLMGVLPHPGGEWVLVSADPMLTRLDSNLQPVTHRAPDIHDFTDQTLNLSSDGRQVGFGHGGSSQRFSFHTADLRLGIGEVPGLAAPRTTASGMTVEDWKNSRTPRLNNKLLRLGSFEESHAVAISEQVLLLGASWSLRRFDSDGKLVWERPVPAEPGAVNLSGDGRLAVAAYTDGTIRWYRMDDGRELLALFPHADGKRWVAWTPSGYYAASAGAEDLIGWHVNRGRDQLADFYPIGLFRDRFYRPDVVALVLDELDEAKALARADAAKGSSHSRSPAPVPPPISESLPPAVDILSPLPGSEWADGRLILGIQVRSPVDSPAHRIRVLRDGSWEGDYDLPDPDVLGIAAMNIPLTLSGEKAKLAVVAYNRHGQGITAELEVRLRSAPPPRKADLYILAVGINAYGPAIGALGMARKDAMDFMNAMYTQEHGLYGMIRPRAIPDAGHQDILDGFRWLEQSAKPGDVAMVFLAGHGCTDENGHFYFLASDTDMDKLESTAVAGREIRSALSRIRGVRYVFLDSCRSGAVMPGAERRGLRGGRPDLDRFANELAGSDGGSVVFSASSGNESSLESTEWDNGAFTKALVDGILGGAAHPEDGDIRVAGLFDWVYRQVVKLTDGEQTPTFAQPQSSPNYIVAIRK